MQFVVHLESCKARISALVLPTLPFHLVPLHRSARLALAGVCASCVLLVVRAWLSPQYNFSQGPPNTARKGVDRDAEEAGHSAASIMACHLARCFSLCGMQYPSFCLGLPQRGSRSSSGMDLMRLRRPLAAAEHISSVGSRIASMAARADRKSVV